MDLQSAYNSHLQALQELESRLGDPENFSDPKKIKELNEAYSEEKALVHAGEAWARATRNLESAKQTLQETDDEQLRALAQEEIDQLEAQLPELASQFSLALVPPDPMNKKSVIVEIRAGTGGDEAALFASDLFRMYTRYAEKQGWRCDIASSSQNDLGGLKEIVFTVKGVGAYGDLKFESGVHRVQRIPETEKQGRVHTSTATVAILPEVEEVDFSIDPKDLKIEANTSQGAGGQSVNTTYSAIRVTHLPTGIVVNCQDERSQTQNKLRALEIIRARVYDYEQEKLRKEREEERRGQIGTGERSEKIRTYNFPQDRMTDHRIKQNFHNLPFLLEGNIEDVIEALKLAETEARNN